MSHLTVTAAPKNMPERKHVEAGLQAMGFTRAAGPVTWERGYHDTLQHPAIAAGEKVYYIDADGNVIIPSESIPGIGRASSFLYLGYGAEGRLVDAMYVDQRSNKLTHPALEAFEKQVLKHAVVARMAEIVSAAGYDVELITAVDGRAGLFAPQSATAVETGIGGI
jgi:hypothetical protein